MAIKRIWHGWTTPANADVYLNLLRSEIFPGIAAKNIPGYRGVQLVRQEHADEVEFMTIMTFDSLANVIAFQGEEYQRAYVPDAAQKVLKRFDTTADHYEVMETLSYESPNSRG